MAESQQVPLQRFCDEGHRREQTEENYRWFLDHIAMVQWELQTILYLTEFYTDVNAVQDREESGT